MGSDTRRHFSFSLVYEYGEMIATQTIFLFKKHVRMTDSGWNPELDIFPNVDVSRSLQ
jgi:hypothetical protein